MPPTASVGSVSPVHDHAERAEAALAGAVAAGVRCGHPRPAVILDVAEALAQGGPSTGSAADSPDDATSPLAGLAGDAGAIDLLLWAVPFGLSSPLDRPRLRRRTYRVVAAMGADEGTAILCVATALVAADLLRFTPGVTAIRVRQSLLEDAPMAVLDRLVIVPESALGPLEGDAGVALQAALSALTWAEVPPETATADAGAADPVELLERAGAAAALPLAAAFAGSGGWDLRLPLDPSLRQRAHTVAAALVALAEGTA